MASRVEIADFLVDGTQRVHELGDITAFARLDRGSPPELQHIAGCLVAAALTAEAPSAKHHSCGSGTSWCKSDRSSTSLASSSAC